MENKFKILSKSKIKFHVIIFFFSINISIKFQFYLFISSLNIPFNISSRTIWFFKRWIFFKIAACAQFGFQTMMMFADWFSKENFLHQLESLHLFKSKIKKVAKTSSEKKKKLHFEKRKLDSIGPHDNGNHTKRHKNMTECVDLSV